MRGARGLGRFNPSLGVSCRAAGLQSVYLFSGTRRGRGRKGSGLAVGKEDEWVKEKKNNPSLKMGLEPGPVPGHRWERSERPPAAGQPGGQRARPQRGQPGLGPRPAGVDPQCRERGAGVTDGGRVRGKGWAAAGARPGGGPAGVGLPSRAPLLLEPREGGAKPL